MSLSWLNMDFYKGKRVLITGHTGFKGSWLCELLLQAGAQVSGYSLGVPTEPSLYELAALKERMQSFEGDVRDFDGLKKAFEEVRPEIVLHLAAQPIVRESYANPRYTYETNVMGTVNVLECIRESESVRSFVNVTTDKVYKNREWQWGYRENEELNGFDPYSNSKSCSELVTGSYKNSFFGDGRVAISTARAGNVIGGGDFARDRIVPDCVRAAAKDEEIVVRNPYSTRPYQHVLEPLAAYLMIAQRQYEDGSLAGEYNVGPDERDCITTRELTEMFCSRWGARWRVQQEEGAVHESGFLKLDCSRLKAVFGWKPRWSIAECMDRVCEWYRVWLSGGNIRDIMDIQMKDFLRENA